MNGHPAHIYEGVSSASYAASAVKRSCKVLIWRSFLFERVRAQRVYRGQVWVWIRSCLEIKIHPLRTYVLRGQCLREASCVMQLTAEIFRKPSVASGPVGLRMLHPSLPMLPGCKLLSSTGVFGQRSEYRDHGQVRHRSRSFLRQNHMVLSVIFCNTHSIAHWAAAYGSHVHVVSRCSFKVRTVRHAAERLVRGLNLDSEVVNWSNSTVQPANICIVACGSHVKARLIESIILFLTFDKHSPLERSILHICQKTQL